MYIVYAFCLFSVWSVNDGLSGNPPETFFISEFIWKKMKKNERKTLSSDNPSLTDEKAISEACTVFFT